MGMAATKGPKQKVRRVALHVTRRSQFTSQLFSGVSLKSNLQIAVKQERVLPYRWIVPITSIDPIAALPTNLGLKHARQRLTSH